MQITKLKLTDITVKERLRGVDSEKVERLKESILRIGLIHPITVSGGVLVAGLPFNRTIVELKFRSA